MMKIIWSLKISTKPSNQSFLGILFSFLQKSDVSEKQKGAQQEHLFYYYEE